MKRKETLMKHYETSLEDWLNAFDDAALIRQLAALMDENALFIVDDAQRVLLWNEGAEKLFGLKKAQMLGQPCPQDWTIAGQGEKMLQERRLKLADGKSILVKRHAKPLYNEEGNFAGGLCLLQPQPLSTPQSLDETRPPSLLKDFRGILSRSPQMQPVFQIIQNAAKTESTVLVRGESGSGKELVARAIHDLSPRHKKPFLAINCAALSSNLLESELFGHVRGAFSGAIKDHAGLFHQADGGTLFLDEVAELPLELQAKLLRVIQERVFTPVGGSRSHAVDVRLVAATHRSLREEVKAGHFREDLMYRLRVVPIFIPPLRERREDINLLLEHFIVKHNQKGLRQIERIDPQAMRVLLDHQWPGNIRELQNVLEYAFVVGRGAALKLSELPPEFRESPVADKDDGEEQPLSVEDERQAIERALKKAHGKVGHAAASLGMSRATFWRKRKLYGI